MPAQALIIAEPWIGHIMAGRKTWEMRSRRTTKRGPVALVRKGSGQIVAIADISDCLQPLSVSQMATSNDKHCIPQAVVKQAGYKWFVPWVLTNVRVLEKPVPYRHPAGAVTWVDLAPDVQGALATAVARPPIGSSSPSGRPVAPVQHPRPGVVATPFQDGPRTKSAAVDARRTAAVSVNQRGKKLCIDAVWDDGQPVGQPSATSWINAVGISSALGAMLCMVTFMIMMAIGIANWSATFFHAFYAVPPMIVFIFIATLTGHGNLLDNAFEGHDPRGKSR